MVCISIAVWPEDSLNGKGQMTPEKQTCVKEKSKVDLASCNLVPESNYYEDCDGLYESNTA